MKSTILILLSLLVPFLLIAQSDTSKVPKLYELSLEELMDIKVETASGFRQTVSEAPSTMRVITAKQIEERGYQSLEDVLRDVEGVDIIHLSGYAPSIIYFRGLYGAENLRTLLMIDGIRENNLTGSPDMAGPAYSLHNVDRIEIIWGPASALYGADAFAGVINIITKKGSEISGASYEKGFGSYNTMEDKMLVGLSKNTLSLTLSGSVFSTDGPRFRNRDPKYSGAFVDKAWSFNGEVTHDYKKFKTTLGFRAYDTPMSWGNFLNSATSVQNLPSQGYNSSGKVGILQKDVRNERPSLFEPFSRTVFLQTEFAAASRLSISARILYRETGLSDRSFVYLSIDTNLSSAIDTNHVYYVPTVNYSNRVGGNLSLNYTLSDHQKLALGFEQSQDNLESGNRGTVLDTNKYIIDGIGFTNLYPAYKTRMYTIRNNFGSYAQYELSTKLLRKTIFTAGIRYDRNSDYEPPPSPRAAVIISPSDNFTLKFLYGTSFRSPTITEVNAAIKAFGSKAVHPEKANTYEMNILFNFSKKCLVQLNGFYNYLTDIFVLNSLTGGGFQQKQTQGTAVIMGGEVRADVLLSENFSGFANFTYQQGTQTDTKTNTEFDIPNLPMVKGNAGITQSVSKLFSVSLMANGVGERTLPHSNPYGADKGYKMPGYLLCHAALTTKKLFNNHVTVSINVKNIFNTSHLDPGIRTADGFLYSTVLEQPGRMVLLKVKAEIH